jgi:hypothetical protein
LYPVFKEEETMSAVPQTGSRHPWPWSSDRWEKRRLGIEKILTETMEMVRDIQNERALATSRALADPALADYGPVDFVLLPEEYQQPGRSIAKAFESDAENGRIQSLLLLLASLQAFLPETFTDFEKLSRDNPPPWDKYSPDSIYRTLLENASIDLNIIQQMLHQRRLQTAVAPNQTSAKISHQGFVLHVADTLASLALQPAKRKGLITNHVLALTYLQEGIDVRLLPYHDVVFLSVPYGAMNSDCDWLAADYLAIPHEIGHYLFWWGEVEGAAPDNPMAQTGGKTAVRSHLLGELRAKGLDSEWITHWLEELFSDAYACAIAGAVSALSFQEMLSNTPPHLLAHLADGKHPLPEIRPLIQSEILRQIGARSGRPDFAAAADQLDANWLSWLPQNWSIGDPLAQEFHLHETAPLSGQAMLAQLKPVIAVILDALAPVLPGADGAVSWTGGLAAGESLADLYTRFTSGAFFEYCQPEDTAVTFVREMTRSRNDDEPLQLVAPRLRTKRQVTAVHFVEELDFTLAGWSTEGPEGSHTGS